MIVIDSSVVAAWIIEEPSGSRAAEILCWSEPLLAPVFLKVEVANVLWKHAIRHGHGAIFMQQGLELIDGLAIDFTPDAELLEEAAFVSVRLAHPVYDCLYLALALRTGSRLATLDQRMAARLEDLAQGRAFLL